MTRALPLIAGLLGVVFLALAAVYYFVPAGSLPSFLPGFEAGADHVHLKHAFGSLIVALILFAVAWFSGRPQRR
jgi:amino acid permease